MPAQPPDAASNADGVRIAEQVVDEAPRPRRRRRRRTDWRQGGRSVRRWDLWLLSAALIGVGFGLVGGATISRIGLPWASFASTLLLWLGMAVVVVFALTRSIPAGLLTFRPMDLMWGLGLGLGLRLLQGWTEGVESSAFPSVATIDGSLPQEWWFTTAVPASVIAPLIEEFFFRGVVLVAVYQLFRRSVGVVASSLTALLASAGGFVLLHSAFESLALASGVQLFVVGAVCALTVLLTGRMWGAVCIHVVYNVSFLMLAVLGTMLA